MHAVHGVHDKYEVWVSHWTFFSSVFFIPVSFGQSLGPATAKPGRTGTFLPTPIRKLAFMLYSNKDVAYRLYYSKVWSLKILGTSCPKINMISLKEQKKSQKYLMQENKFSGILGLCLYAKPNSCMQLWNQFSQPRDIFFDILSMSFPHSHVWSLSARNWIPLLGSWKLKQK